MRIPAIDAVTPPIDEVGEFAPIAHGANESTPMSQDPNPIEASIATQPDDLTPAAPLPDPQAERDARLAESIDTERRHLATVSQAARVSGFRAMEARLRVPLSEARTHAPWLAWVHVLADWSRQLQGPAARQRLAEADAVFAQLQDWPAASLDEARGIDFARAYYLRLRARHESGNARRQLLAEAAQLLARLRDPQFSAVAGVALEQAELALASTGNGDDDLVHYQQATAHATAAADVAQTRVPAFRALLSALLGWQRLAPLPARAQQAALVAQWLREADVPASADTLCVLAQAALTAGNPAEAARLSASAWQAGADERQLLAAWQQADAQWARQSSTGFEREAWERQHRLLRLASSTT